MPTPTRLEVAQRKTSEPCGITGEEAHRWLEAHKPAPAGIGWQQAWLELHRRKIQIDAQEIAALPARHYVPAGVTEDSLAAHNAAVLAEATRRRINQLHQAGHDIPDTSAGSTWTHPPAGPAQPVGGRKPIRDGWIP